MSAEQVLRFIIVKVLFGFTYEELAFTSLTRKACAGFAASAWPKKGLKNLP